jgi:dTDP-glucose 4,6-dehydratase
LISHTDWFVVNVDKLTYAGNLASLSEIADNERYCHELVDISDHVAMTRIYTSYRPDAVLHLAAESHVDRSIDSAAPFIQTNIVGTYTLLEAARSYWQGLEENEHKAFRFVSVSTDEVFGALGPEGSFTENTPYDPSSPYSASKASADHLVRAWQRTYGLPVIVTNCSNNYGPYQFPEKLIPVIVRSAAAGRPLPVYGTGQNVRDWIYVDDHAEALIEVLRKGKPGESYNIGSSAERTNLEIVSGICRILDKLLPDSSHCPHESLISYVTDRPGHDFRYSIDASKVEAEIGWTPRVDFATGLQQTVEWYLSNEDWCQETAGKSAPDRRQGFSNSST